MVIRHFELKAGRQRHPQAGFSLVELLIALAISTTVLGAVVMLTGKVEQAYNSQLDGASIQQEARYTLERIVELLRVAGSNPYGITVSACPTGGTNFQAIRRDPDGNGVDSDIRIQADVNPPNALLGGLGPPTCSEAGEDLTIDHDPATRTIRRRDNNTAAAPVALTDSVVTALQFTYRDTNRALTANDAAVAFVETTVTAQTPTVETGRPVQFTLRSEVRIRSR